MHIVLLGGSVFDNAPFTSGGPAVIDHLNALLAPGEEATLLAVDGDRLVDVWSQVEKGPSDGTHFFLSIGGNDALTYVDLLNHQPTRRAGEGLALLGEVVDGFADGYRDLLEQLTSRVEWLQVCTIYDGDFGPEAPIVSSGIRLFNDAIQRVAASYGVSVIELRDLLNHPQHFTDTIQVSIEGGRVLAEEIVRRARG